MSIIFKGYVGKKGEIYIEKKGREAAGLKPSDRLIVIVSKDKVEILKIPKLKDILEKKPLAEIDDEEIERISLEYQKRYLGD